MLFLLAEFCHKAKSKIKKSKMKWFLRFSIAKSEKKIKKS
jgi:hypothetical protein